MKTTTLALSLLIGLNYSIPHAQADVIDFLFGAGRFGRNAGVTADCRNFFRRVADSYKRVYKQAPIPVSGNARNVAERSPRYLNDLEFLEENKYSNGLLGVVNTSFDKDLDTRVYFTTTAKPLKDGTIPRVDSEAKALVIYFHGSGTSKASGATFAGKMNALAKLGYSSLSFDLPWHADGSRNNDLRDTKNMVDYVHKLIQKYRVQGQEVILVGHSFGPEIISEYITHYPKSLNKFVLLSPAGMDDTARRWNEQFTSKMDFGEMTPNDAGGQWAAEVSESAIWNKPGARGRKDPTRENDKLQGRVLSGESEEYLPGELGPDGKPTTKPRDYDVAAVYGRFFEKNIVVTIEPKIGHLVFSHQDALGRDVVMREVLAVNGEDLINEKEIRKEVQKRLNETRTVVDNLATRYSKDIFFREWFDQEARKGGESGKELIAKMIQEDNRKVAQKLINNFGVVEKQRTDALNTNIKNTANWAPQFYNDNKALIGQLGNKGFDPMQIHTKYLNFLKTQNEEVIAKHAVVDPAVYVVPERPVPQGGPRPEQQQGGDRRPRQQMADGSASRQQGDNISPTQMGVTPSPAQLGDRGTVRQQGDRSTQRQLGEGQQRTRQPGDQNSSFRQQGDSGQAIRQQGERQRSPHQQGDQIPSVPQFEGGPRNPQPDGFPSAPQQQGFFPIRHLNQNLPLTYV